MHGFINLFMAAAIPDRAEEVLVSNEFSFDKHGAHWCDVHLTRDDVAFMRRSLAISFGSCSFEEPVNDLKELGWL
jgi:hypothetical protein